MPSARIPQRHWGSEVLGGGEGYAYSGLAREWFSEFWFHGLPSCVFQRVRFFRC
jgi:hypothetical protein